MQQKPYEQGGALVRSTSQLMRENTLEKMTEILKAVAHPVRLQVVNLLMNGERSVGDLVKLLGTKQSLTSQQLGIMKSHRVVKARRNATVVYYSLKDSGIKNIMASIIKECK